MYSLSILEKLLEKTKFSCCPYCGSGYVVLRSDTRYQCLSCGKVWN